MNLRSLLVLAAGWVFVVPAAHAASTGRVERPGSIGLGAGGGYGLITGSSRFGSEFDDGWGFDIQLKYVVGPHWSMGLGFQSQSYLSTTQALAEQDLDKFQVTDIRLDTFYYRNRNQNASQYAVFGLGIYRPEIHYAGRADVSFPGENLELSFGLGVELFLGESWGLELGGRAIGYFGDGMSPEEEADPDAVHYDSNFSLGLRGQAALFFYIPR
jgi:hypothetical protein